MMARFIVFIIIIVFLFGCAPAHPPQTLPEENPTPQVDHQVTAEDLARYELSHATFHSLINQANKAMLRASRPALEKTLGKGAPRPDEKELVELHEKVLQEVYPEEIWLEPLSKLYARIFTPEEIKEILTFYQSNAGRRLRETQFTLMQEAEKMAAVIFRNKEEKFVARLEEELGAAVSPTPKAIDSVSRLKDTSQLHISETIQACRAIQKSAEKPVGCAFYYYEGRPAIAVTFQDYKTATLSRDAVSEQVVGPFCQAANEAKRPAVVVLSIQPFDMARMFFCETHEWGDWFNYNYTE